MINDLRMSSEINAFVAFLSVLVLCYSIWIDNRGSIVGTAIRIGLIVVGAAMWILATKQDSAPSESSGD